MARMCSIAVWPLVPSALDLWPVSSAGQSRNSLLSPNFIFFFRKFRFRDDCSTSFCVRSHFRLSHTEKKNKKQNKSGDSPARADPKNSVEGIQPKKKEAKKIKETEGNPSETSQGLVDAAVGVAIHLNHFASTLLTRNRPTFRWSKQRRNHVVVFSRHAQHSSRCLHCLALRTGRRCWVVVFVLFFSSSPKRGRKSGFYGVSFLFLWWLFIYSFFSGQLRRSFVFTLVHMCWCIKPKQRAVGTRHFWPVVPHTHTHTHTPFQSPSPSVFLLLTRFFSPKIEIIARTVDESCAQHPLTRKKINILPTFINHSFTWSEKKSKGSSKKKRENQ